MGLEYCPGFISMWKIALSMSGVTLALLHVILASKPSRVFVAAGKFTTWSKAPSLKAPSQRAWEMGCFLPWWFPFKWGGSQILERVLGCETVKTLLSRTFQRMKEMMHKTTFLKSMLEAKLRQHLCGRIRGFCKDQWRRENGSNGRKKPVWGLVKLRGVLRTYGSIETCGMSSFKRLRASRVYPSLPRYLHRDVLQLPASGNIWEIHCFHWGAPYISKVLKHVCPDERLSHLSQKEDHEVSVITAKTHLKTVYLTSVLYLPPGLGHQDHWTRKPDRNL